MLEPPLAHHVTNASISEADRSPEVYVMADRQLCQTGLPVVFSLR